MRTRLVSGVVPRFIWLFLSRDVINHSLLAFLKSSNLLTDCIQVVIVTHIESFICFNLSCL